uniref:S-acyltransferase n=1 Tax=Oryza barthii TaxID=65489 RepID=A0A0D3FC50_9ORYZ
MARRRGGAAAAAASPAVVGAVSVLGLVYYSTVFVFLDHWLGLGTLAGAAHAAAFSLVVAACFFSFVCAAAADPGSVPASFAPDAEDPQRQGLKSRYCDKCCMYKPSRTHHCKVCKRCVLKMDHHCVWINNCVGYANYKSFIICVLNATIGSLYSLVVFLFDLFQTEHEYDVPYVKIIHVLVGVLLFFLSLTIGSLLCWHIYLLCHNMTTIEYREATRAKWLAQKSGQKYRHRFDLGTRKNIQMIMGPNILCWLCPTATGHLKDGTEFQITNN